MSRILAVLITVVERERAVTTVVADSSALYYLRRGSEISPITALAFWYQSAIDIRRQLTIAAIASYTIRKGTRMTWRLSHRICDKRVPSK